jgi:RNA polymerase sigma-70 factor (ECF subfamily)
LLQTARLASRVDAAGDLIPLDRQDRARWDRAMIAEGFEHLGHAATGDVVSPFHLEAAIAGCHALAATYAATDWPQIVALYDQLLALTPSPVIALQRAILHEPALHWIAGDGGRASASTSMPGR